MFELNHPFANPPVCLPDVNSQLTPTNDENKPNPFASLQTPGSAESYSSAQSRSSLKSTSSKDVVNRLRLSMSNITNGPASASKNSASKKSPAKKSTKSPQKGNDDLVEKSSVDELFDEMTNKKESRSSLGSTTSTTGFSSPLDVMSTGKRRMTADAGDLRKLMADLHNSETKLSNNRFSRGASLDAPTDRRMTVDAGDLEGLMTDLNSGTPMNMNANPPSVQFTSETPEQMNISENSTPPSGKNTSNSSDVSSRIPTPHAKFGSMDDISEDELPPLATSPMEDEQAANEKKRSASMGTGILSKADPKRSRMSMPAGTNNRRKSMDGRKSMGGRTRVAFGSPQAAEFNFGSPSGSLTPMPTSEVKEIFTIPSIRYSTESDNTSTNSGDVSRTVELESELNDFLNNLSREDAPAGDIIENEDNTVELEEDISAMLQVAPPTPEQKVGTPINEADKPTSLADSASKLNFEKAACAAVSVIASADDNTSEAGTDIMEEDVTVDLESSLGAIAGLGLEELSRRLSSTPIKDKAGRRLSVASITKSAPATKSMSLMQPTEALKGIVFEDPEMVVEMDVEPLEEMTISAPSPVAAAGTDRRFSQQQIDITCAEIMEFSGPSDDVASGASTFVNCCDAASDNAEICIPAVNEIMALCVSEVEAKCEESLTGEEVLAQLIPDAADSFAMVQAAVQKGNFLGQNQDIVDKFELLREKCKSNVLSEWNFWEEEVVKQLIMSLNETANGIKADVGAVALMEEQAANADNLIMELKTKIAKEARRRSLGRRKNAVKQLNEELELLNHQVEMASENLGKTKQRATISCEICKNYSQVSDSSKKTKQYKKDAKTACDKFTMLEGMLSWTPVYLEAKRTIIRFAGEMKETTVHLGFENDSNIISAFLLQDEKTNVNTFTDFSFSANAKKFAAERVSQLREYLHKGATFNDATDIVRVTQLVQMQLGRIELVAREISLIGGEFESVIESDKGGHVMTVDFSTDQKKLRVCFEVGLEYPFSPMNISLNPLIGDVNLDSVGDALVRNVKPGYGYVARVSDCISSYLSIA